MGHGWIRCSETRQMLEFSGLFSFLHPLNLLVSPLIAKRIPCIGKSPPRRIKANDVDSSCCFDVCSTRLAGRCLRFLLGHGDGLVFDQRVSSAPMEGTRTGSGGAV